MLVAVGLGACAGPRGGSGTFKQTVDSATSSCRHSPSLCAGADAVVPVPRAVQLAVVVAGAQAMLDEDTRRAVEESLKKCADDARSEILDQQHGGKSPTQEECKESIKTPGGESMTRAIWFGEQMHTLALECAQQKLESILPGRFSIEPTYRFDPSTRTTTLLSAEEVMLLKQPRFVSELKGTIVPDIVIHSGSPLKVTGVYDFKFPCVNPNKPPAWRTGANEDGSSGRTPSQKERYMEAFGLDETQVLRVIPRLGVFR
ncbi:hypothetical protein D7Y13_31355 [Corallococcus praedator]|uniref:Lipoprotein n=1 Tax=Corallococcus praedator TaxID=2316724 RepID=A0ABX9QBU6_9BACT|nr:hypothetical protein D7X75_17565 [Corallococcus sp. CA031C]RKH95984.1 hypothetical protein D7Y13_31355 [Corallococcus praedator]